MYQPDHIRLRNALACLCAGVFALLLVLVVTEHAAGIDDPIRYFFYELRGISLTRVLVVVTNFANKYVIIGLCIVLLLLPRTRLDLGVPLSAGALATTILNHIIKIIVCRERPDILHLVVEDGYSFPSGHSISSMFFYGMAIWLIWHYAGRQGLPGAESLAADAGAGSPSDGPESVVLAADTPARAEKYHLPAYSKRTACIITVLLLIPLILVGLTRIYLGVHFPTDVLAGWCLGAAAICVEANIIVALERRAGRKKQAR